MPHRAFSLLELLVVIAIIGILLAIILPAIEKSNERARIVVCGQNLHQSAVALGAYASDFNAQLANGPDSPSAIDPARNWNTLGNNLLWIAAPKKYNGMGLLLAGTYLNDARALVCPSDNDATHKPNIARQIGGTEDAYGSYAYRQLDQRASNRLTSPGNNSLGTPATAVAMDWQCTGPTPFARNSHDSGEYLNILYADGHIQFFHNDDLDFGATQKAFTAMPASYIHRLDQVWINADWVENKPIASAPKLP